MRALPFALALTLAACSGGPAMDTEIMLDDSSAEGKADSITGKSVRVMIDAFSGWGGGSAETMGLHMSSLKNSPTVRAEGIADVFEPFRTIKASATTFSSPNWLNGLAVDMVVIPYARRQADDGSWPQFQALSCVDPTTHRRMNYASSVLVDLENHEIDMEGYKSSTQTFNLTDCGFKPGLAQAEVAFMTIVASDWGRTLDGDYGYTLHADCDGFGRCDDVPQSDIR